MNLVPRGHPQHHVHHRGTRQQIKQIVPDPGVLTQPRPHRLRQPLHIHGHRQAVNPQRAPRRNPGRDHIIQGVRAALGTSPAPARSIAATNASRRRCPATVSNNPTSRNIPLGNSDNDTPRLRCRAASRSLRCCGRDCSISTIHDRRQLPRRGQHRRHRLGSTAVAANDHANATALVQTVNSAHTAGTNCPDRCRPHDANAPHDGPGCSAPPAHSAHTPYPARPSHPLRRRSPPRCPRQLQRDEPGAPGHPQQHVHDRGTRHQIKQVVPDRGVLTQPRPHRVRQPLHIHGHCQAGCAHHQPGRGPSPPPTPPAAAARPPSPTTPPAGTSRWAIPTTTPPACGAGPLPDH